MATNVRSQGVFRHLVRTYRYGVEWTHNSALGRPVVLRNTVAAGQISSDGGNATNARLTMAPGLSSGATGAFTVNDLDFSTGPTEIVLGDYRLRDTADYAIGLTEALTATAIAAAISRLPGWSATANLAVVSIIYDHPADETVFKIFHYGSKTNFNTLVPATGYLALGNPTIGPPLLTP